MRETVNEAVEWVADTLNVEDDIAWGITLSAACVVVVLILAWVL